MVRDKRRFYKDRVFGDGRCMSVLEDYTNKEEEIQFLKDRINWIDVHETMFELSPILVMDREYCKERLKELEGV